MAVYSPRRDIAPSTDVSAIIDAGSVREGTIMFWGLIPAWSQPDSALNVRCSTPLGCRAKQLHQPIFRFEGFSPIATQRFAPLPRARIGESPQQLFTVMPGTIAVPTQEFGTDGNPIHTAAFRTPILPSPLGVDEDGIYPTNRKPASGPTSAHLGALPQASYMLMPNRVGAYTCLRPRGPPGSSGDLTSL